MSVPHYIEPLLEDWSRRCQDLLVEVGAVFERDGAEPEELVGESDMRLRETWDLARKGMRLATLFREPEPTMCDPVQELREKAFMNIPAVVADVIEARRHTVGDAAQIVEGVRWVMEAFELQTGGRMRVEVTAEGNTPRVTLKLEGGGSAPDALPLDDRRALTLDEFAQRWIGATQGGHVAKANDGIILYLEGERPLPELHLHRPDLAWGFARAEVSLRSWRAANGIYEPGYVSEAEIQSLYLGAVNRALEGLTAGI